MYVLSTNLTSHVNRFSPAREVGIDLGFIVGESPRSGFTQVQEGEYQGLLGMERFCLLYRNKQAIQH
jgi:hypothetical protein